MFAARPTLVVWDHVDTQGLALLTADAGVSTPAELLAGLSAAAPIVLAALLDSGDEHRIERRVRLMTSEPEVRTGELQQIHGLEAQIRRLLAARLGRDDNDLAVRYAAAQAAWGYLAAVDHWAANEYSEPLADVLRDATALLVKAVGAVLD
ncbi:hypothetical protein [Nocardia sp. NPDC056100]|uniref:acyl-CoA-like ligand-binding transcription factor n=1 Tax=Nocardia sp. NPDC056100 TaxID=3345712 RepID=UPI0035D6F854